MTVPDAAAEQTTTSQLSRICSRSSNGSTAAPSFFASSPALSSVRLHTAKFLTPRLTKAFPLFSPMRTGPEKQDPDVFDPSKNAGREVDRKVATLTWPNGNCRCGCARASPLGSPFGKGG